MTDKNDGEALSPVTSIRGLMLALILSLLYVAAPSVASAHSAAGPRGAFTMFNGQVSALDGPRGNPTGFTLQIRSHSIEMRIVPDTTFTARSAEAEVEGFVAGDYALVAGRRFRGAWIAYRIDFDVRPVVPGVVSETGTVVKVTKNGMRFQLRPDTSDALRWVTITPQTRFRIDGQPADGPLMLTKGDAVQVLMRSSPRGWLALEINLRSGSTSLD